jgi:hypothetical protein
MLLGDKDLISHSLESSWPAQYCPCLAAQQSLAAFLLPKLLEQLVRPIVALMRGLVFCIEGVLLGPSCFLLSFFYFPSNSICLQGFQGS